LNKSTKKVEELLEGPKFIKAWIDQKGEGDPLCAYERIALPENPGNNFFLLDVSMAQMRSKYFLMSGV
jgi:hypothetical protein